MKKLVFFDIDGTLLDSRKQLPPAAKAAIQSLQQKGIYTAIATGRAPFMFEGLRKELNIDTFVSFNGQYVVLEGEAIYKNPLSREDLGRLAEKAGISGHSLVFLDERTMKANVQYDERIDISLGELKFPHPDYRPDFYLEHDIYQSLLFCKSDEQPIYEEQFQNFTFIRWHDYSTDVLPAGGSKAEGIQKIMEKLGVAEKDVYAFGDGLNDLEMLKAAGTGIAMGNALQVVKDCADIVTTAVDDDGIVNGLMKVGMLDLEG